MNDPILTVDRRNVRELKLPQIPKEIIQDLTGDYDSYKTIWTNEEIATYKLTDSYNDKLDVWGKKNICESIYWEFQIITGDLGIHCDSRPYGYSMTEFGFPVVKFVYLLATGGDNVITEIYDESQTKLIESYKFELHKWYLFNVQQPHRVIGMQQGKTRFAVVGHVF